MSYVDDLNSEAARDAAFRDVFLGDCSILFENVDEVKAYLCSHASEAPFHWLGSKEVTGKIKTMAQAKYIGSGYGKAKKVIDDMPAEQVKEYLKRLIEDNITVGVEIMKGQK